MMIIKKVSAVLAVLALCLVFAGAALAAETGGAKPVLKGTAAKAAKAATAAKAMKPVNINKATAAELAALDGVGPVLAKRIVDYRTKHGAFKKPEDIKNVKGIGDAIFNKNKAAITLK